jgi:hypothetical protein
MDIPEFEDGAPRPGFFTDDDWKKNRAGQFRDMKQRGTGS